MSCIKILICECVNILLRMAFNGEGWGIFCISAILLAIWGRRSYSKARQGLIEATYCLEELVIKILIISEE